MKHMKCVSTRIWNLTHKLTRYTTMVEPSWETMSTSSWRYNTWHTMVVGPSWETISYKRNWWPKHLFFCIDPSQLLKTTRNRWSLKFEYTPEYKWVVFKFVGRNARESLNIYSTQGYNEREHGHRSGWHKPSTGPAPTKLRLWPGVSIASTVLSSKSTFILSLLLL